LLQDRRPRAAKGRRTLGGKNFSGRTEGRDLERFEEFSWGKHDARASAYGGNRMEKTRRKKLSALRCRQVTQGGLAGKSHRCAGWIKELIVNNYRTKGYLPNVGEGRGCEKNGSNQ